MEVADQQSGSFLRHHPDAVPVSIRRVAREVVAALDVRGRQLVSRMAGKRLLELADGVNELASAVIPL